MTIYRGVIRDHVAIESAKKGTPGIEFKITLEEEKHEGNWVPINQIDRKVWLYFPQGGDHLYTMKKLAFAGYKGGGLDGMNLVGNACEVVSRMETYDGKEREKFELALPGGGEMSERSETASMAIDSILRSQPVPDVRQVSTESVAVSGEPVAAGVSPEPSTVANSLPSDDVPF